MCHARYSVFHLAEAALPRAVFAGRLGLITGMRGVPAMVLSAGSEPQPVRRNAPLLTGSVRLERGNHASRCFNEPSTRILFSPWNIGQAARAISCLIDVVGAEKMIEGKEIGESWFTFASMHDVS